jgi:hypothetical protein
MKWDGWKYASYLFPLWTIISMIGGLWVSLSMRVTVACLEVGECVPVMSWVWPWLTACVSVMDWVWLSAPDSEGAWIHFWISRFRSSALIALIALFTHCSVLDRTTSTRNLNMFVAINLGILEKPHHPSRGKNLEPHLLCLMIMMAPIYELEGHCITGEFGLRFQVWMWDLKINQHSSCSSWRLGSAADTRY